jgi:hypothetical protein
VIRDPDNPANRVLSVRYDAQASGGGVQLKHRESSALNASRVELTFRFRLLSCTSDYAAFGFIQLRRASQTMNVGLAGYEWCKIVSTETTINGKDASILSGDTEWHTAALTLTRGSGADTGAVSVDGRLLYQFQQPSAAFDSCELSIGSFFTSSQGAVQVMFDNVLAVITP